MAKRVLIGSPVHQQSEILHEFLMSLVRLDKKNITVEYWFVDDNTDRVSSKLLAEFADKQPSVVIDAFQGDGAKAIYQRDDYTHYWKEEQIWKVAEMKDSILAYAKQEQFDYLFLIDSDLVLHPNTLQQLIQADKDIISNIFWTKWQPETTPLPQVWLLDEYTLYPKKHNEQLSDEQIAQRTNSFLQQLREPGVYEVGGLGACTLISKRAIQAGVKFAKIPNITFWGEDRHFCVRAAALGFSLYVDTHYPAYHLYRSNDLGGLQSFKRRCELSMENDDGISISLCMIVKNEADVLERCLSSIRSVVDEIIIIDTGSTDETKAIAEKFGANVYDFAWVNDFSAARNFAFAQATKEYIFWLDADDLMLEEEQQKLAVLKKTLDRTVDAVSMHYNLAFDGNGKVTHSLRRNRLVRRERNFRWNGFVHEYLQVSGNILHSDIAITHKKEKPYTDRNLQIYREHQRQRNIFSVRDLYYFANELADNAYFEEAITYYEKFLTTKQGWVEDNISACIKLGDCYYRLAEREKQKQAFFRTFHYDNPRAEACCRLGFAFLDEEKYDQAIYWYTLATQLKQPQETMGYQEHAAWTWLPHLQLCLCYDRLKDLDKAFHHHQIAYSLNPDHPSIQSNHRYFEGLREKQTK